VIRPPTIAFGCQTTGTLDEAASREWLLTDGLGGYAMGTVAGLRTRRYHGLLCVARGQSRMMGLAALDAVVVVGDRRVPLGTDEWVGGTVSPAGHTLLESFAFGGRVARWRWNLGSVVVERELALAQGQATAAVVHRIVRADRPVTLELTPLCTWRDANGDRAAGSDPKVEAVDGGFVFEGAYRVLGPAWEGGGSWYLGARYREEASRGLNDREDLWAAGTFRATLGPGEEAGVVAVAVAGDGVGAPPQAAAVISAARARAGELLARAGTGAGAGGESEQLLCLAADQFIVAGPEGPSVYAGYPWFGDWSRDAMTSYEGLFLATGRADEGRRLLLRTATTLSDGLLANSTDAGLKEYNTADATLWFVHAVGRHVARTGDVDLAAETVARLADALTHYLEGTHFGIGADPADGLMRQGAEGWALTWMDARVDGVPQTPRAGKAVEINALWINALATLADLLAATGGDGAPWRARHDRAVASFSRFVRGDGGGLFDVVDVPGGGDDGAVRPNQLLAASLPHAPLRDRAVVDACRGPLLTPIGLRSLDPAAAEYRGRHRGGPAERDGAYHQGTVWPWLIGPFVDASLACGLPVDGVLDGLENHLREWGLGSVSETADGDAPHATTGCPFQAWSVAETLRALERTGAGGAAAGSGSGGVVEQPGVG
jgi:predicted glycogen debranching enzyme